MFYFLILILILIAFLLIQHIRGNRSHTALIFLLAFYFMALSSIIIYVSKDTYYYNLIKSYFSLPNFIWRWFFFFGIGKLNLIRLMNLSSLGIVLISTYFTFSFYRPKRPFLERCLKIAVWIHCLFFAFLYDPATNYRLYYFLYPRYMTVAEYRNTELFIESVSRTANSLIVVLCMAFLLIALRTSPKLKLFRFNHFFLCISYGIFSLVYIFFISSVPSYFLKISKIAGTHTYRSIPLGSNAVFYDFLPYFLIAAAALVTYCTYRLAKLTNQMALDEFSISKEISSSETTSKIFCHYIKNEILALESELDLLVVSEKTISVQADMKKRCQMLYSRIDEIHRSTKTSELNLKLYSLQDLLNQAISSFSIELSEVSLTRQFPVNAVSALVDPVYMEQALHNIIRNSIDAMADMPKEKKELTFAIKTNSHWVWVEITDTGKGISKENLPQIFLPFYSSYPYSRHWGIGLTLTYKIIHAHEGKIDVDSTPGKGTTIRILLPLVSRDTLTLTERKNKTHGTY